MTTTTVRDIPEDIYFKIKQSASANRRSINAEIIHLLDSALSPPSRPNAQEELKLIRQLRKEVSPKNKLGMAEINAAKREDRA